MQRRTFLGTLGAGLAVAVAGCTESGSSDGDDPAGGTGENGTDTTAPTTGTPAETTENSTRTPREPSTETEMPATGTEPTEGSSAGTPSVADASLEVTNEGCGGGPQEATVTVDGDTVTVDGVLRGSDGCHTARLAGTSVDGGTLTVSVESYVPESEQGKACIDCIVDIEYTATVTLAAGSPETVVVEHGDERITEAGATGTTTEN
ncbi:hypothetical protein [Halomarina rubra]|uniref:Uncharacterized protein n=1 Tax=Halomarina rubra TaxID=2071873 RepID=A0ABD6B205_9EURY|nr:hypothetical protein [Halomarina rubra]